MERIKPSLYIMPTTSKPFRVVESGRITKIVFSCDEIQGKLNNQDVFFKGKDFGQHTIEYDQDHVSLDLTLSSPDKPQTGYLVVYKLYKERYQKSDLKDDLEGV